MHHHVGRCIGLIMALMMNLMLWCQQTLPGKVIDDAGLPIVYATVYVQEVPEIGTATDVNGCFQLDIPAASVEHSQTVAVSCVGYALETIEMTCWQTDSVMSVTLHEQPIALEQTVVTAKKTRMSKRKVLATILHHVYARMEEEWPKQPVQYQVVSDVKMDADSVSWGVEQLVATAIEIPSPDGLNQDSLQFVGQTCRRYCDATVRERVDSLMLHETDARIRKLAVAMDSGTIVHRALWRMTLDRSRLLDTSDELARWKWSYESETTCVLTYTRKYNYLGIVKATVVENLLVDTYDFSLQSYTVDIQGQLFLPISVKLKGTELEWVNLLNMNNESLEKFRLKRGSMHVQASTLYDRVDGQIVPKEKNLHNQALLEDRNGRQLPCEVWSTQHVTKVQTQGVSPLRYYRKSQHVQRGTL